MATVWKDKKLVSFNSTLVCSVMLEAMKPFAESRMMEGTSKFQQYLPLHFTTSTWGESITTTKCTSITRPQRKQISGGETCFGSA